MSEQDKKFEDWMGEKVPAIYQGQRIMLHRYDTMDASEETLARSAWDAAVKANAPQST